MALLPWKRTLRESTGPSSGFEEMALPLLPALFNLAQWLTRNPGDAEDLVQETYLKALRGFAGFTAGTNFKAWIFRILRNTYLTSVSGLAVVRTVALEEELREEGPQAPHYPESVIDRHTPELQLIRLNDAAALNRALEKLPQPLLEVILLCDVEEMKYKDIATTLEVPIGTVMSRVSRARKMLRDILQSENTMHREVRV